MSLPPPLPDRDCGECSACCVDLVIDAPGLSKPDGVACPHLRSEGGCGIYADRPATCRHWYCGWRFMRLSDAMRPDRSGVLLAPELRGDQGGLRVVLLDEDLERLTAPELVDFVARCILGGAPIFLSWGEGAKAKRLLVNPQLEPLARRGDRSAFVRTLIDLQAQIARAYDEGLRSAPKFASDQPI